MVILKTNWEPDTCSCKVIQSKDTVTNITSLDTYSNTCSFHSSISNSSTRYSTFLAENQRKNNTLRLALVNLSAQLAGTDPVSGAISLKQGIIFNWSFSGTGETRVLDISFSGITLTAQQKTTLQTFCNTNFGSGKAVVS
jgi:hypothetical protein